MRLLFLLALLFSQNLNAQHFAWMRPLPTIPNTLAVDAYGNALVQTARDVGNPGWSHQLRLLNPAGQILWIKDMPNDLSVLAPVKTDLPGNFYFPVQGLGSVTIDGLNHTFNPGSPIALAKLRADGSFEWLAFDTPYLTDFDFDSQGNLYTIGLDLLQKWDVSGASVWKIPTPTFEVSGGPSGGALDVDVVNDDRIVVAGKLQHALGQNIHIADTTLHFNDQEVVFLAAFDQNGQRKWLKTGGTSFAPIWHEGLLAHDQNGMVYFGFNPFSLNWEGLQLPPDGEKLGPALFKIAAGTGQQIWAKNYPEWSWLHRLAVSPDGALFLVGELRNLHDPGGEIVVNGVHHPRQLNYQAYAARFSTDGVPEWLALSNDSDGAHFNHITCGPRGNVWVSGFRGWYPFGETRYGTERLFLGVNGTGAVGLLIDTLASKPSPTTLVAGTVFDDIAPDCQQNAAEPGLEGLTVIAEPGPFLAKTDASGRFSLALPPGNYKVRPVDQVNHAQRLTLSCLPAYSIQLPPGAPDTAGLDFPFDLEHCTALAASFDVGYGVECVGEAPGASVDSFVDIRIVYGNFGAAAIDQTDVHLDFPPEFYPVSATPVAWTEFNTADSSLLFSFSDLQAGSLDTLNIRLAFNCDKAFTGIEPPSFFPFSAQFSGPTNDCYPEDSVLNRIVWEVQYYIPVGTGGPAQAPRFSVSPNPSADGMFRIKNEEAGTVHWEVSDALGRLVHRFTSTTEQVEIDLRDAPGGVYYLCGRVAQRIDKVLLVRW